MTDVKRALAEMAERGKPIGSTMLRQKVLGELVTALPRPRRRHPALVLAGAAVGTLLLVGLGGLALLLIDEETPVAEQPAPTDLPVTPEQPAQPPPTLMGPAPDPVLDVAPTLMPEPSPVTWTEVAVAADDPIFYGGFLNAVTIGGPGLVAVGGEYTGTQLVVDELDMPVEIPDDPTAAAVWVSENAVDWRRVESDSHVFDGPGNQEMLDVAVGSSGIVAVGRETWDPIPDEDWNAWESDAAAWTSNDGTSWQRVPDSDGTLGGSGSQLMRAVITGGPGFIAVGSDGDSPAIWVSVDGSTWDRAEVDEPTSTEEAATIHDVVAYDSGFVAVGAVAATGPLDDLHWDLDPAAAVWTSKDGLEWSRVPHDASVFDEQVTGIGAAYGRGDYSMHGVAVANGQIIAVGQTGIGQSQKALWVSRDGTVWKRVLQGDADWGFGWENFPRHSVVAEGERFTAVGVILQDAQFDGYGRQMNDAVIFGDEIVAVGSVAGGITGAIWSGTWGN
jgi:hypothetical protein